MDNENKKADKRRRRRRNAKNRTAKNYSEELRTVSKIIEKPGRHMKIHNSKDYLRYQHYTHKEICKIDDHETVINVVNNIPITVKSFRNVYIRDPNLYQSSTDEDKWIPGYVVAAALTALCQGAWTKYNPVALTNINEDIGTDQIENDETYEKVKLEYEALIEGKNLLLIPIFYDEHCTLALVDIEKNLIEFYDSQIKLRETDEDIDQTHLPPCFQEDNPNKKIEESEIWEHIHKFIEKLCRKNFTKEIPRDLPIQTDNHSCSLFTILIAERRLKNLYMSKYTHDSNYVNETYYKRVANIIRTPYEDRYPQIKEQLQVYKNITEKHAEKTPPGKPERSKTLTYKQSCQKLKNGCKMPFLGYDKQGNHHTYNNPNKDWKNMLSLIEITEKIKILHNTKNPETAKSILKEEIKNNKELIIKWDSISNIDSGDQDEYNFRWGNKSLYLYVKKHMLIEHEYEMKNKNKHSDTNRAKQRYTQNIEKKKLVASFERQIEREDRKLQKGSDILSSNAPDPLKQKIQKEKRKIQSPQQQKV